MIGKETERVYLYTSKANRAYLKKMSKKNRISQSKIMNSLLTQARLGETVVELYVGNKRNDN